MRHWYAHLIDHSTTETKSESIRERLKGCISYSSSSSKSESLTSSPVCGEHEGDKETEALKPIDTQKPHRHT